MSRALITCCGSNNNVIPHVITIPYHHPLVIPSPSHHHPIAIPSPSRQVRGLLARRMLEAKRRKEVTEEAQRAQKKELGAAAWKDTS